MDGRAGVRATSSLAAVLLAVAGCGDDSSSGSDASTAMGSDASCEVSSLPIDVDAGGLLDNCTIGGGGGSDGGTQNGNGSGDGGSQNGSDAFEAGRCYVEFDIGSTSWDSRNMSFSDPFANVNGSGEGVALTIVPGFNSSFIFEVGGGTQAYMGEGTYPVTAGGLVNGTPYTEVGGESGTLTIDKVTQPASTSSQLVEGSFTSPVRKNDETRVTVSGTYRLPLTKVNQGGSSPMSILVSPGLWDDVCSN